MLKRSCLMVLSLFCSSVYSGILLQDNYSGKLPSALTTVNVSSDSLNYPYLAESGGSVILKDCNDGLCYKLSPKAIEKVESGTIYLAVSFKNLNASCNSKFAGIFLYKDNTEVFGAGNDFGSDQYTFWIPGGQTTRITDTERHMDQQVHRLLIEISQNKTRIALDPIVGRSVSRQPDHIWTEYPATIDFDEIRLRCGENNCSWQFDELVLADSFEDTCPTDSDHGEYINFITNGAKSPARTELIYNNIARFWSDYVKPGDEPYSLALQSKLPAAGPLPENFPIKPAFSQTEGKKHVYIPIDTETDLYGTGEVTGSLLRNGYKIVLQNIDIPRYAKPDQLYQSHPWVIGVNPDGTAFGVLFDTTWPATLDLSSGILFTTDDDVETFPVIICQGFSPQQVMSQLAKLIGTIPMPPRWSLGYHQCRWSYYPDARAREIGDLFRAKQMPCDVIWFDIHYMDGFRIFTFDKNNFPDPKATNDYLHSLGFKTIWMVNPGIKDEKGYGICDSGTENDVWVQTAEGETLKGNVHPGRCVFPDFTSPRVRKWWGELYRDFMALGIDGVWNDMNEPYVGGGPDNTMPMDSLHRGGGDLPPGTHKKYHNIYGMYMAKGSYEGIQELYPDKRPFVLTRSNYIGGQRYAATWTGDNNSSWEHLKWSIPMAMNMSLAGQPFSGPDIGGFNFDAPVELWKHWISVGAFYPFSRAHATIGTSNQEPWEFGPEAEIISRVALQRRYWLMPYLYSLFAKSHKTGQPVMNPIFFADPADMSLRMENGAFLLGQDLIIVPKWASAPQLPSGNWPLVSLVGEDTANDQYQCDVRIRPGAIVPLGPVVQTTAELPALSELTLLINLDDDGKARGGVYEDAGDGYEFKEGQYSISGFSAERNGNNVIVRCEGTKGNLAPESRIVKLELIESGKVYHALGDICSKDGIKILLN